MLTISRLASSIPQTSFQPSFWDPQDPQEKLMQEIPFLGRLAEAIPWEDFRPMLESIFEREGKSPVGRKRTDVIIMFKLLVLQQYLNCSDMRLEFQVRHNLCLRYFVGLGVKGSVPDANTVWLFRRRIQQAGIAEQLFHLFSDHLKREGLAACGGQIIDSTIIPVPKQHNRREENAAIKRGELSPRGGRTTPHGCGKRTRMAGGPRRIKPATTVTRTASALMPSMA